MTFRKQIRFRPDGATCLYKTVNHKRQLLLVRKLQKKRQDRKNGVFNRCLILLRQKKFTF